MSQLHCNTQPTHMFSHLAQKERELIEQPLNEGVHTAQITNLLHQNRSIIYQEIKRGIVLQIKAVNGYEQEIHVYYSVSGFFTTVL